MTPFWVGLHPDREGKALNCSVLAATCLFPLRCPQRTLADTCTARGSWGGRGLKFDPVWAMIGVFTIGVLDGSKNLIGYETKWLPLSEWVIEWVCEYKSRRDRERESQAVSHEGVCFLLFFFFSPRSGDRGGCVGQDVGCCYTYSEPPNLLQDNSGSLGLISRLKETTEAFGKELEDEHPAWKKRLDEVMCVKHEHQEPNCNRCDLTLVDEWHHWGQSGQGERRRPLAG